MADRFTRKRSSGGSEQPIRSAAGAAERIGVIIEAAERAAAEVIDDAEREARRYVEDSRRHADQLVAERLKALSSLTESLADQAESVKRHADRLIGALEEAQAQIDNASLDSSRRPASVASEMPDEAPNSRPGQVHLQPVESPPNEEQVSAESPNDLSAARLLATQMAISGSSRTEIDACLRNEMGVTDPEALLEAILGPGS